MEFINCKNHGGPMVVVATGEQFIFKDNFSGIVAIAQKINIKEELGTDKATFEIEYCAQINEDTIKRIISKHQNRYMPVKVKYHFNLNKEADTGGLPYYLEIKAIKRK